MGSIIFLKTVCIVCALAIITSVFNKRILKMPPAIGVPIVSAILVFLLQWIVSLFGDNPYIYIDINAIEKTIRNIDFYNFLINGVICFILTSSALKFQIFDLKRYWRQISILASIALLLCAVLFGVLLYGYQFIINHKVELLVLLLLGSALGATDPIGIKGVMSSIRAPHHLMIKLEGESLFNDAVCIAIFMTLLGIQTGNHFSIITVIETLIYEIIVAVAIGWIIGLCALHFLKGKHEMESLILMTALLASLSYLVAIYAHASAPIACVIAGLVVGNRWQQILAEKEIREINHFWHTIEGIINSFLFTLIGLELSIINLSAPLIFGGIVAFIILHISRFIANYLSFSLFPSFRKNSYHGSLTILSWGGVRGGISLALILAVINLPQLQKYSDILIGYTFFVVLLSGVVCGLGLPAVINAFYHNDHEPTTGFSGWYQRMCHKLNRTGIQYIVEENAKGDEYIMVYNPTKVALSKSDPENEIAVHPKEFQEEIDRLENPNNF